LLHVYTACHKKGAAIIYTTYSGNVGHV